MTNELTVTDKANMLKKSLKGRTPIKIDDAYVYELATYHCTHEEIATLCGVHVQTLQKRYSGVIAKGYDDAKKQLRKAMIRSALSGNVIMQIWLSKNWLGFKERQSDEAPTTVLNIKMSDVP